MRKQLDELKRTARNNAVQSEVKTPSSACSTGGLNKAFYFLKKLKDPP